MTAPVRFSHLKRMAQSPAHYRYYLDHPQEPTAAMRIGTVAHAELLGAWRPLVAWTGGRRYGKEWDAFAASHKDYEIVSESEWNAGRAIAGAVRDNPDAEQLLSLCDTFECDFAFSIGDRACGVRLDANGPGLVVEFKTCADASPARFPHQAIRMGYHAQLAWQIDALNKCGIYAHDAYIIAAESKPPHNVVVYEVTPASIDLGRRTYWLWWERLMACEAADEWPGYVQSIVPLEPPMEADDVALTIGDEEVTL